MSSAACHVSWVCNRFPTNDAVHSSERNFQSYRKNFKHALESQRLANPIRPHPHAATTQKTAEPVPPCTAARRGNYGMRAHSTFGQERAGCSRRSERDFFCWLSVDSAPFRAPRTPRPFLSACSRKHCISIFPVAAAPHTHLPCV